MKPIAFILFFLFLGVYSSEAQRKKSPIRQSGSWVSYTSKKNGFKVSFPEKPYFDNIDVSTPPIKRTNYMHSAMTTWGFFGVVYSDNPVLPVREKQDLNADYEFLKGNISILKNAEIISEKEFIVDNISGREFKIKSRDLITIDRLFLVNRKLYQVIVTIDYEDLENKYIQVQVQKFFNSFTLLK